jgi:DNA primase
MDFVEQVKSSVNIVHVIGEYVGTLRKSGRDTYKGLCPFHQEKTPSFNVHESRQFFHCFGCHATGDVFKFIERIQGISFYEALKQLAERYGIPMPKRAQYSDDETRLRGALFAMHEIAQEHFRASLLGPAGAEARNYLERRGVSRETIEEFGLGYSLPSGRALLQLLEQRQFPAAQTVESGLIAQREGGGGYYDRFRNRLMFPIHSESGKIIAYGGRALSPDEKAKYLNSSETPIYKKSRTLYNLHRAKEAIRREGRAILVEGYMDAIGVSAAGVSEVVALCGTALSSHQIQALRGPMKEMHARRVVLNLDPDSAGDKAAERVIAPLLEEGMQIRIMELDGGLDPDEYCKDRGCDAYRVRLEQAKGYFYWLADSARKRFDMRTSEGKISALQFLLPAVQRISDRLERMTVANDVAGYLSVERSIVLDTFLRSAAGRNDNLVEMPKSSLRADERGLINVILSECEGREQILAELADMDIDALDSRRILQAALAAYAAGSPVTHDAVSGRLEENDRRALAEIAFAFDPACDEFGLEWGWKCLAQIKEKCGRQQTAQLKALIQQAERAGNLGEAMRLMGELNRLELANNRARRGVQ